MSHEPDYLINEAGAAVLTLDAAITEKTAEAQRFCTIWFRLARAEGLPAAVQLRYRKAVAWGASPEEIRALAAELHQTVGFFRAAQAAGWNFVNAGPAPGAA